MIKGIALGFLAYGLFAFGDAAVKALAGKLSVFEIGFFGA
ncbi:MAG: EamA/RhaT family transporter, partial [Rhizobiales bacterium]|nr:EamA/RhaT family transporter [Hyphomicrobiales bacterium]